MIQKSPGRTDICREISQGSVILCAVMYMAFRPAGQIPGQDRVEHSLSGTGMLCIELFQQLFGILTLCVAVDRTFALDYRKVVLILNETCLQR